MQALETNSADAVVELKSICLLHFSLAMVLSLVQKASNRFVLPLAFLSFFNAICLAERFWKVQRRTMGQWSIATQICFLLSRVIVVAAVLFMTGVFMAVVFYQELRSSK